MYNHFCYKVGVTGNFGSSEQEEITTTVYQMQAKMHSTEDFSHNFLALIKHRGLSQLEIAALSGIHKQSINRYVMGKTEPKWPELLKLADALGCTLDSFRTGSYMVRSDLPAPTADPRLEEMKPIIKELGSVVSRLTDIVSR